MREWAEQQLMSLHISVLARAGRRGSAIVRYGSEADIRKADQRSPLTAQKRTC